MAMPVSVDGVDEQGLHVGGFHFPGHSVVHDATGACVAIEPGDETRKLHDNPLGP